LGLKPARAAQGYAYLAVALGLFVFAAVFIVFVFQLDSLLKREATRRRLRSALQRLTVLSRALGICVLAVCAFALPVFWEMGFRTVEAGETRMPQSLDDFDMASRGWRIAAYVAAIVLACASQVSGETRRSGRVSLVAVGGGSGDDDEEGPQVWDSGAGDDGL
jgi:O-antigen/teichoic acid export membrane protein